MQMVLGRTCERVFGSVRFYLNVPSRLDFAAESCGISRLAKFYGIPTMRIITTTTALKMPLWYQSSAVRVSGIPDRSKQVSLYLIIKACFYPKQQIYCLSGAERWTGSIGEVRRVIKACFHPTGVFSVAKSNLFLIFKAQTFCVLKNCISPFSQPRNPVLDHRSCFILP